MIGFRHESLTNEELAAIKAANPSATNLATTGNNNQSVGFSDFVLKEVLVPTGTKYTWDGARYAKVTDSTDSKDGGYAYDVDRAMQQNISTDLALKPATNYSLTFNWKSVANENGLAYVQSASVYSALSGDRTPDNKTNYKWTDTDYVPVYVPNEGYFDLLTDVDNPNGGKDTAADNATLTAWNTYSATFTTSEEADYYLFINFGFKGTKYDDQNVIISDVVIEEIVTGAAPAGDDMIGHGGLSLRKEEEEGGQAIRYKFGVDKDVINAAQTDGYELVEYGAVVAVAEELNAYANDPVLDATKYTVRKGVAYDKANGTSVVFDETDEEVIYTIALYNIPTYNYDTQIAVRPYAVFKNSAGDSYVRYGTTRYGCVFEVAQSIIANPEKQDDLDYVNNTLLAGDVKAAYDAWAAN